MTQSTFDNQRAMEIEAMMDETGFEKYRFIERNEGDTYDYSDLHFTTRDDMNVMQFCHWICTVGCFRERNPEEMVRVLAEEELYRFLQ